MRYFAGLTVEEIAEVMKISPTTVKREWTTAKLWLRRRMSG
jgi:DNA-directed RNA polymerase specialized sigma24 family protein